MKIVTRYEDLTVEQFQKIEALKASNMELIDRACHKLAILSNKTVEEIEALAPKQVFDLLTQAGFLNKPIHQMPIVKSFMCGIKSYKFIDNLQLFSTAQRKDYEDILKANNGNWVKCMPELLSLITLELTPTGYKYIPENHFKKIEDFKKEKLKYTLGAVFFYSNKWNGYSVTLNNYLAKQKEIINEAVKMMNQDLEFQVFLKGGGLNTQSV